MLFYFLFVYVMPKQQERVSSLTGALINSVRQRRLSMLLKTYFGLFYSLSDMLC